MSSLEGTTDLSLANGLTWIAILALNEQPEPSDPSDDERVIFEAGGASGRPKVTVAVQAGALAFVVTDVTGTSHSARVPSEHVVKRQSVYLACELAGISPKQWRSAIFLNDNEVASAEFEADLGDGRLVQQRIGSNLEGKKNAAFSLAEMMMFKAPLSGLAPGARAQFAAHFRTRYKLR